MFRLKHILLYKHTLLITLALAGVWGCRKDEEILTPYPNTLQDIKLLLKEVPGPTTKSVFNFKGAVKDTLLATSSGVRVLLADTEALFEDENKKPVPCSTCQSFSIEITEATQKSDFAAYGIPNATTDGSWFESIGAVRITANCDGKSLKLIPTRKLKIQFPSSTLKNGQKLLVAQEINGHFKGWSSGADTIYKADWFTNNTQVKGYELLSNTLGWISGGELKSGGTSFCITMPDVYTPQNTVVFLSFKTSKTLLALQADQNGNFCFPSNIPSGSSVKVLTISKLGEQYLLFSQELTDIGSNTVLEAKPAERTAQDIIAAIKGL
jgi:hypothetical protein